MLCFGVRNQRSKEEGGEERGASVKKGCMRYKKGIDASAPYRAYPMLTAKFSHGIK